MKIPFLFFAVTLLAGCVGATDTASDTRTFTASMADRPETENTGPGAGQCLLTYQRKMDEALPLAVIKKHYAGDLSTAKLAYSKSGKYPHHDTYKYELKTGRTITREVMGMKVNVPETYEIGLAWIERIEEKYNPDPVKAFYQMYHTPTAEELARAKEYMDKQLDKKMAEKGMTSSGEKKAGKAVSGGIMNRKIEFQKIPDLGDGASWSVPDNELHVLAERTKFRIIANTGPNGAANLELARKLAAEVLVRCK